MTLMPPPQLWAWLRENWKWLGAAGGALVTVAGTIVTNWLLLSSDVDKHGAMLAAIQAEQAAIRTDAADQRRVAADDQRERDRILRDWQRDVLLRDQEISRQLSAMNKVLGSLEGQLAQRGSNFDRPRVGGGPRQFDGSGVN